METLIGLILLLVFLAIWVLGSLKVFKHLGVPMGLLFAIGLPALMAVFAIAAKGQASLLVGIPMIAWGYILYIALRKDKQARKSNAKFEIVKESVRK